jgi:hypothetical protein
MNETKISLKFYLGYQKTHNFIQIPTFFLLAQNNVPQKIARYCTVKFDKDKIMILM